MQRTIVSRPWERHTFAVIDWHSDTIDDPDALREAIQNALRLYVASGGELNFEDDFNIGDLSMIQHEPGIQALLALQGITRLEIQTFSDLRRHSWEFDDRLAPAGMDAV